MLTVTTVPAKRKQHNERHTQVLLSQVLVAAFSRFSLKPVMQRRVAGGGAAYVGSVVIVWNSHFVWMHATATAAAFQVTLRQYERYN